MAVKRRERKLVANVAHQMVLTARQRIERSIGYGSTTPGVAERRKELALKHKDIIDKVREHQKAAEVLLEKLKGFGVYLQGGEVQLESKEHDKLLIAHRKLVNAKLLKLDDLENKAILLTVTDEGGMREAVLEIQKGIAAVLKEV